MSVSNSITDLIPIVRGLIKDNTQINGDNLFEYRSDNKFPLSELFVESNSIKVYINGTITTSFTYDSDTNYVTVTASLSPSDIVRITFNYYKKYSDTELGLYINSSLPYFVQHRYKKTFKINNIDEIVSVNDQNPNTDELYFICIVASILIDPQNIEIVTPEFKLGRNREDSDQKQIADAFAHFKRFTGTIYFQKDINKRNY